MAEALAEAEEEEFGAGLSKAIWGTAPEVAIAAIRRAVDKLRCSFAVPPLILSRRQPLMVSTLVGLPPNESRRRVTRDGD